MVKRVTKLGTGFRLMVYWGAAIAVVLLDQATKAAVRRHLALGAAQTLLPGVLDLRLVHNTGAAFSLGEGAGPLFVAIAFAILAAGVMFVVRVSEAPAALYLALGCVAGGGIGNAIDRLFSGHVTDFLATTFVSFPIFNVADSFITCGVIVALVSYGVWDSRRGHDGEGTDA